MGLIRTLLAISVLVTHSEALFGRTLLSGDMAVTCFYMVSGFLITLILTEKYADIRAFYVNRALRIYVPYLSAVLVSLVVFSIIHNTGQAPVTGAQRALDANGLPLFIWSTISNLTLVGIDLTRYIGVNGDFSIAFPNFMHGGVGGGESLIFVPQAWTLGIELSFYVLAPFLVRMRVWLLALVTFALLLNRIYLFEYLRRKGFPIDDASAFPMQLEYFLLGALGYHVYRGIRAVTISEDVKRVVCAVATLTAIVLIFTIEPVVHHRDRRDYDVFYVGFAALIPFAFYLTRNWKWDSRIGEYSYPIYLFHFAVNAIFWSSTTVDRRLLGHWQGEAVLATTLIVCTVYIQLVDRRVQRVRAGIARRSRARKEAPLKPVAATAD